MFLEYLNDVDMRSIIADIQKKCKISYNPLNRLAEIDSQFIKKTSEINVCIWCDEDNTTDIYPKTDFWYYYRIPPEHIDSWSVDINWMKEIAEKRGVALFCEK